MVCRRFEVMATGWSVYIMYLGQYCYVNISIN